MFYFPLGSLSFLLHFGGLLAAGVISAATLVWLHRRTRDRSGRVMVYLLFSHVLMASTMAAQMVSPTLALKRLWVPVWTTVIVLNGGVWIVFALYYTGRDHLLTTPVWALLGVSSGVPALVTLTNPFHGLMMSDVLETEPFWHLAMTPTDLGSPVFAIAILYILVGATILFRQLLVTRRSTWWQHLALVVGLLSITLTAGLSSTELAPIQYFPYGIYGSAVFGVLVTTALFRTRLFAVAPLARDVLFESIDDGIVVVDAERRIVDFNDAATTILPDIDDSVARDLADVYPDFVRLGNEEGSESRSDGGRERPAHPFAENVTVGTADGTRSYRLGVSEIKSGGEPRGYAIIVRDVTELERYASELERKTEQLERFAGFLSHDLRNPVAVASGHLELEAADNDSDHVRSALTAVERIDDTIDDLLTLASQGELDEQTAVSLHAVAADAWATSDVGSASLELAVEEGYQVRADRSRLQTVFENLFRNAVDHASDDRHPDDVPDGDRSTEGVATDEGRSEPVVTVGPLRDGFYVADDGPGIPEETRDDIFEYGYSTSDEGTGFGLSIVKSIVDAHGWRVSVIDGETGGARFEIRGVEQI